MNFMRAILFLGWLIFFGYLQPANAQSQKKTESLKLWYDKPARIWEEALPLGNGKTAAMQFGTVAQERFQLNNHTLWSGYPRAGNNPEGPEHLKQIRKAIFDKKYDLADQIWQKMRGPYSEAYLPMADLLLSFQGHERVHDYYRDLNLSQATTTVSYRIGEVRYTREAFISYPDNVLVIRIKADRKAALNMTARLNSKLRFKTHSENTNTLVLTGKAPRYVATRKWEKSQVLYDSPGGEGMNFVTRLEVQTDGGVVSTDTAALKVQDADAVTLYLSSATSFDGFKNSSGLSGKDPAPQAAATIQKAIQLGDQMLRKRHLADYSTLFSRVDLRLARNLEAEKLPINQRMQRFSTDNSDLQLVNLYFQYGRYLLLASSRPGSRPANLQGIWNDHVNPPWRSNYTININTQMNYWGAENSNLSECHQPLLDFLPELAVNGAVTAKVNYGIHQGWMAHHNSDLWAKTSPAGGMGLEAYTPPQWAAFQMGALGWLRTFGSTICIRAMNLIYEMMLIP